MNEMNEMTETRVRNKLDYLEKDIKELDRKIENASGWWTDRFIEQFKKERWQVKKQREEFYNDHVEYLL